MLFRLHLVILKAVVLILEKSPNVNSVDRDGLTALAAGPGRGATPTFVSEAPLMRRSEASDLSVIVTYSAHDISAAERAAA